MNYTLKKYFVQKPTGQISLTRGIIKYHTQEFLLFQHFQKGTKMGKKTKYPAFSNGSVSVNGQTVATTNKNGDIVNSNYNMTESEKQLYDYAQNSYLQSLPNVNVFDENTQKNLQSQVDAYKNKGLNIIDSTYTPMLNNLKNDIASRFGNFDNSIFMNNLNSIENNRSQAMSALAEDVLANQSNLINDELSRRYNYLNLLSGTQDSIENNILNYLNAAMQNSSAGNSYNQAYYNASNNGGSSVDFANLASQIGQAFLKSKFG